MRKYILLSLMLILLLAISIFADYDERYEEDAKREYSYSSSSQFAKSELYTKECGACHFAYQAELLPKRSWIKLMSGLNDHFGEDAVLDENDHQKIYNFLVSNAGDVKPVPNKDIRKFIRSIPSHQVPIRISEIPYFKKEHREIPKKFIVQDEVKSLSHCQKCHTDAEKGTYRERNINIPNYGAWDD